MWNNRFNNRHSLIAIIQARDMGEVFSAMLVENFLSFFAHFFAARELTLALHWRSPTAEIDVSTLSLKHWDFFFIMAALIGLYSLHRLGRVQEEGEVAERVCQPTGGIPAMSAIVLCVRAMMARSVLASMPA